MDPVPVVVLLLGGFLLVYGLGAYRIFFHVIGAAAGLVGAIALCERLVHLPGLSEHPKIASGLIYTLFILLGIFLATRFRRILAFLAGLGTGVICYRAALSLWNGNDPVTALFQPESFGAMDLLSGLTAGVLFLLFEPLFALVLTSAAGAALCTYVLGGRWTFTICFVVGMLAQPFISKRFVPDTVSSRRGGRGNGTTALLLFFIFVPVTVSFASWQVHHVNNSTGRITIDMGQRQGIRPGDRFVILDSDRKMIHALVVSEVFFDTSYSEKILPESLSGINEGMSVMRQEDYDYGVVKGSNSEESLLGFVTRYPDSKYRTEIEESLDQLRYDRAASINTVNSYREFRRMYPGSRFAKEASGREEMLAFERTVNSLEEESFRRFLDTYPGTSVLSGIPEARLFIRARKEDKVYACQDFLARFPDSKLADICRERIKEFEKWAHELEFGSEPVQAIRFFADYGDETAIPLLVGKLLAPDLGQEARKAIIQIGEPSLSLLMEVLISPLQSIALKDEGCGNCAGIAYLCERVQHGCRQKSASHAGRTGPQMIYFMQGASHTRTQRFF
jgi:hypothetical protein